MMLDFDLADADDRAVVDVIGARIAALPAEYPAHVLKIGAVADLDAMLASGRLVDEMAVPPPRPSTTLVRKRLSASDITPRIKLKVVPLSRRALAKAKVPSQKRQKLQSTRHPPRQALLPLNQSLATTISSSLNLFGRASRSLVSRFDYSQC